jgi:hypothetical protein
MWFSGRHFPFHLARSAAIVLQRGLWRCPGSPAGKKKEEIQLERWKKIHEEKCKVSDRLFL